MFVFYLAALTMAAASSAHSANQSRPVSMPVRVVVTDGQCWFWNTALV